MRIVGLWLLAVVTTSAQAEEGTRFNGFHVNMTRQEVIASKPAKYALTTSSQDKYLVFRDPRFTDFDKRGTPCAEFIMEGDTIEKMRLLKCFFGAEDLPSEDFIKVVLKSYGLNASCKSKTTIAGSEPHCVGTTGKGEVFEVDTGQVSVTRMRQKPNFN